MAEQKRPNSQSVRDGLFLIPYFIIKVLSLFLYNSANIVVETAGALKAFPFGKVNLRLKLVGAE